MLLPARSYQRKTMSRFKSLAHTIWYCHYHIIWVPKYRYKILKGEIKEEVEASIRAQSEQMRCEIEELNVQEDHVHMLVMIPPKLSVSKYVGRVKGKTAIRVLSKYGKIRIKPYWGNHFWARGYCVDTVGLDPEKIRKYIKYQEKKEER
jgi:putative transposase